MTLTIPYYGSKRNLIPFVLSQFPKRRNSYIEVFGGGASVLLNKKRDTVELYNDLDALVYSFFKCLQSKSDYEELKYVLENTPYSRREFDEAWEKIHQIQTLTLPEKAKCFLVSTFSSFGSNIDGKHGFRGIHSLNGDLKNTPRSWRSFVERIELIKNRFSSVLLENTSFEKIISRFDHPNYFLYLDPPYVLSSRSEKSGYRKEMTDSQHRLLVNLCLESRSKILISGYENEIYTVLEDNGWFVASVPHLDMNTKKPRFEVFWKNYSE